MSGATLIAGLAAGRRSRSARRRAVTLALAALLLGAFALTLMLGQSFTPPSQVLRVLAGHDVPGAGFTVGQLRLPRAVVAVLAGASFGLGGAAFQVMLRNPLASPDIIGVSAGASAAAVFAIVFLGMDGAAVSVLAIAAGMGVALLIYLLSFRNGVTGARLILVGIGISAMIHSFIAYALARAPAWSLQEAMRWLSGSLNAARIEQAGPLLAALVLCGGLILSRRRDLEMLRMGDNMAAALGVRVAAVRLSVMLGAVGMIAVASSITGPIAFVAFLAGPIALRITGPHGSVLVPAALVGAVLVLGADYAGQFLLPARYPVGVVTGALGAPFLLWLIIRANRTGGSS
ncbi:FecCD family ABC transporter permease [Paracoccus tibetensis]|uniref:Iron complex transport system permease protein n=1 Tax=Paracoccus tibetensis TaxID=336292 RepID=A0A1G5CZZ2_9RHOB|nr:iron chelate uptake ABC transporter family permease subunit [Paracoccus tibetensis]SCY07962.1 iron complex transport system permease protein [Paracoccus tibetensis]